MDTLRKLLGSKKFVTALTAAVVAAAGFAGLNLTPEQVALIITPLTGYILGQSHVDATTAVAATTRASIAKEINDAAPASLPAAQRLDALDRWVRAHAGGAGAP